MNIDRFIEKEFANTETLVGSTVKIRTLNSLMEELKNIEKTKKNNNNKAKIKVLENLIKDAYIVDMYSFAFKIFTLAIQKEMKNIQRDLDVE